MKNSPLKFGNVLGGMAGMLSGNVAGMLSGGFGGNRPRSIQELVMGASRTNAAISKHESRMHQDEGGATNSSTVEGIRSVQDNLINPSSAGMIGNIQPMGYNETGFSNEMVRNSEQIFNTPEERNKII